MTTVIARLASALATVLATEAVADGTGFIVEGSSDGSPVRLRLATNGDKVNISSAPTSLRHRELAGNKPGVMNASLLADDSQTRYNAKVDTFLKRYLADAIEDSRLAAEFANGDNGFAEKTAATVAALGDAVALTDVDGVRVGKVQVGGTDQEASVKVAGESVTVAGLRLDAARALKVIAALRA